MGRPRREVKTTEGSASAIRTRAVTSALQDVADESSKNVLKKIEIENTDKDIPSRKRRAPPEVTTSRIKKPLTKFPDRLQWKMTHASAPPTSTPIRDPRPRKFTKADIDNAFGFDESMEAAEYSVLVSPIAHTGNPKDILPPPSLWKVHPLTQRNVPLAPVKSTESKDKVVELKKNIMTVQERRSPRTTKRTAITIPILSASRSQPPVRPEPSIQVLETKEVRSEVASTSDAINLPSHIDATTESTAVSEEPPKKKRGRPQKAKPIVNAETVQTTKRTRAPKVISETPKLVAAKLPRRTTRRTIKIDVSVKTDASPEVVKPKKTKTSKKTTTFSKRSKTVLPTVESTTPEIEVKIGGNQTKTTKKTKTVSARQKALPAHVERKAHIFEVALDENDTKKPKGESPFSQLLHRYNDDDEDGPEELHVDPKKIVKTYASKKRVSYSEERDTEADYDFIPRMLHPEATNEAPADKGKQSRKRKGAPKNSNDDEELDEATKKWLEEKNKEFEDVEQVTLVVEKSISE